MAAGTTSLFGGGTAKPTGLGLAGTGDPKPSTGFGASGKTEEQKSDKPAAGMPGTDATTKPLFGAQMTPTGDAKPTSTLQMGPKPDAA